jgi:hypothetical protein
MTTDLEVRPDDTPERVEVYALDLDWDLINHLAIPSSVRYLQGEQVAIDVIEDKLARHVFEWQMEHTREHQQPAAPGVLEDQFEEISLTTPQTAIGDLILRLRERYMRNRGRTIIKGLAEMATEDPLHVAREMMRQGRSLADITTKRGEVYGTGDFPRALARYNEKVLQGKGPSIGYRQLDEHFNGLLGTTFLLAPPKTYKSWFVVNGVLENIIQGAFPYLYSLELPADESDFRLRCMAAGVPYWKYVKRCLTPEDLHRIDEQSKLLDEGGCFKVEKPSPGERGVARMVERALAAGADSIWIDQLQYMENRKGVNVGAANNTGDYWEVCNDLRDYSDEIPIFVVHQFNRSVMNAKEMPEMQQAKGSSAIEEVATLQLGLWANKEMRKSNTVHIGTLASRNFSYGTWEIGVNLSYGCELTMRGPVEDEDED